MADTRLFEEQYSKEDLEIVMDNLLAVVRATIKRDLAEANHGAVILLKQILEQAEGAGVAVRADLAARRTARCSRRWRGGRRRCSRRAARRRRSRRAPPPRAPTRASARSGGCRTRSWSPTSSARPRANAQLAERVAQLRAQAETVGVDRRARRADRRRQRGDGRRVCPAAAASDGAAALRAQVSALEAELAAVREAAGGGGGGGGGHDALRAELVAAQERVAELASQLGDAQAECVARVEKTKQAASLRQMLTKKNCW